MKTHIHRESGIEVTAIGGRYRLKSEHCLLFFGREVLYLIGYVLFDTTCCGTGGFGYALVPGFIVDWKTRKNEEGFFLSSIEPIRNIETQRLIREQIMKRELVQQVGFQ